MLPAHLQSHLRQAAAAPRSGLHPQDNHWQASTNCDPTYHIAFQPLYFCLGRSAASLSLTWPGDHPPDSTARGRKGKEDKERKRNSNIAQGRVGASPSCAPSCPVLPSALPCPAPCVRVSAVPSAPSRLSLGRSSKLPATPARASSPPPSSTAHCGCNQGPAQFVVARPLPRRPSHVAAG